MRGLWSLNDGILGKAALGAQNGCLRERHGAGQNVFQLANIGPIVLSILPWRPEKPI